MNIFCDLEKIDNNKYKCKNCGNNMTYIDDGTGLPLIPCATKISESITENLNKSLQVKPNQPNIFRKGINFLLSAIKHILTGAKRTSKEERDRRLSICTECPYYDGVACTKCGCPITRYQQYISKLDWKDQKCPIGKW